MGLGWDGCWLGLGLVGSGWVGSGRVGLGWVGSSWTTPHVNTNSYGDNVVNTKMIVYRTSLIFKCTIYIYIYFYI